MKQRQEHQNSRTTNESIFQWNKKIPRLDLALTINKIISINKCQLRGFSYGQNRLSSIVLALKNDSKSVLQTINCIVVLLNSP